MAALDVVTIAEATAYLNANGTGSSPLLDAWISAASATLDDLCGPVIERTITGETHYVGRADRLVRLDSTRVVSCASVVEYDAAGTANTLTLETPSTKPADAYRHWADRFLERRSAGASALYVPLGTVVVTYTAGRFANTAAVTYRFRQACLMLIAHLWAVEHGTGNTFGDIQSFTPQGFAIPRRVVELLGSEIEQGIVVA